MKRKTLPVPQKMAEKGEGRTLTSKTTRRGETAWRRGSLTALEPNTLVMGGTGKPDEYAKNGLT